jgi:hypothetical protein
MLHDGFGPASSRPRDGVHQRGAPDAGRMNPARPMVVLSRTVHAHALRLNESLERRSVARRMQCNIARVKAHRKRGT